MERPACELVRSEEFVKCKQFHQDLRHAHRVIPHDGWVRKIRLEEVGSADSGTAKLPKLCERASSRKKQLVALVCQSCSRSSSS